MIIHDCAQGSDIWHQIRSGVCTASKFTEARGLLKSGPNKGQPTEAAKKYAFRLAVERISGVPLQDEEFETFAMRRGRELEPEARRVYEIKTGIMVKETGFITTEDRLFGASADGMTEFGGLELKCFTAADKLRKLLLDDDLSDVMDQIQGGLWISGLKFWHMALYCPFLEEAKLDMKIIDVKRDESYIYDLEQDLMRFNEMVADYQDRLTKTVRMA